jgi:hypothetical protein
MTNYVRAAFKSFKIICGMFTAIGRPTINEDEVTSMKIELTIELPRNHRSGADRPCGATPPPPPYLTPKAGLRTAEL